MNINIEKEFINAKSKENIEDLFEYDEGMVSDKNKCVPIFIEFSEANKKNTWPSKTNIDCFWCCHSFDNTFLYSNKKGWRKISNVWKLLLC